MNSQPNVIFVFGDQWRAQATGYAGNPDVRTPNIDRFASQSINFRHAVSGYPVCCPARACYLTGQHPLTHGVFVNDVHLEHRAPSIADAFAAGGYDTAYIGKWHLNGRGRAAYIPPADRQGFDYWKVLECTHDYNHSLYYDHDDPQPKQWPGYDALSQTDDACRFIQTRKQDRPFLMFLSWGPPHEPYDSAPPEYRAMYSPDRIRLRPNVPDPMADDTRRMLAGYYAHCSALDDCFARLLRTLDDAHLADNTIVLFTSDHGDMLGSQGHEKKQRPWDESIRVPFLLRYPAKFGERGRVVDALIDTPDLMPTLLGLAGLPIPSTVEGRDFSRYLAGGEDPNGGAVVLSCAHPFGQYNRADHGGVEYRGLRTARYTYVRTRAAPWLLYDNQTDPYQLNNLVEQADHQALRQTLDAELSRRLRQQHDTFEAGDVYIKHWGYEVDEKGTVPYQN
ncbi:MAG: sulfatase family protein [Phycisphaerales bacterium]